MDQNGGSWAARHAADVGRRVWYYRDRTGVSAQQLADKCADLGLPSITRTVITKLENGRREAVSTAELLVLAAALDVPPILLVIPLMRQPLVEILPGLNVWPWAALLWFRGDSDEPGGFGVTGSKMGGDNPIVLMEDHWRIASSLDELLAEREQTRKDRAKADDDAVEMVQTSRIDATARTLGRIRSRMRDNGLIVPPVTLPVRSLLGPAEAHAALWSDPDSPRWIGLDGPPVPNPGEATDG